MSAMLVLEGAPGCGADIARRLLLALGLEPAAPDAEATVPALLVYRPPWDVPEVPIGTWVAGHRALLGRVVADDTGSTVLVEAAALAGSTAAVAAALAERTGVTVPTGPDAAAAFRVAAARAAGLGVRRRAGVEPTAKLLAGLPVDARLVLGELDRHAAVGADGGAADVASLVPADHAEPQVAVVVACRDDGEHLLDALASVRAAGAVDRLATVVVDDGSTDAHTVAILDQVAAAGVTVLRRRSGGALPAARNAGVATSESTFVLALDADNLLRPGFATAAVAALTTDATVAAAYPDLERFGAAVGRVDTTETDPDQLLRGNHIDACAVVRRSAFDGVGGFDESLGPAMADWDLWLSLRAAGHRLRHLPTVGFDARVHAPATADLDGGAPPRDPGFPLVLAKHRDLIGGGVERIVPQFLDAIDTERARADAAEARIPLMLAGAAAERAALEAAHETTAAELALAVREIHVLRDQVAALGDDLARRERGFGAARARAAEERVAREEAEARLARTVAALDDLHQTVTFRAISPLRTLYGRLRRR